MQNLVLQIFMIKNDRFLSFFIINKIPMLLTTNTNDFVVEKLKTIKSILSERSFDIFRY